MAADNARTARRLIAIFELFARRRTPLGSGDIAAAIDCPKSSLSSLLKTLVDEGVLNVDRATKTYFPAPRIVGYADWVLPQMFRSTHVDQIMEELRERTSETVLLTVRNDLHAEVIQVTEGHQAVTLNIRPGYQFGLWTSAVGEALLSAMNDRTIYALVRRVNRRADGTEPLNAQRVMSVVKQIRQRGYAAGYSRVLPGVGALAAPLSFGFAGRELVLSVGGPELRVREHEARIAKALLRALDYLRDEAAAAV